MKRKFMSLSALNTDIMWMQLALAYAQRAAEQGEVPVGSVLVQDGRLLAAAHNQPIATHDPCAHAEIRTLRQAGQRLRNYRLPQTTLFVTLEPCVMCAGALMHARVARIVYATHDLKTGACGSVINLFAENKLNHHAQVESGLLQAASAQLLQAFFAQRRAYHKAQQQGRAKCT